MNKSNEQILRDAVTTTDLASGGIMNQKQAAKFLQMVFDTTALLQIVRTINMPSPKYEIDKIGVGQRIMRGMTENEDMSSYTKKPIFGKIELDAKKYALPWELSVDALEDNIEGKKFADVIASKFAKQTGLDTEDLAVNGDVVYSGAAPDDTLNGGIDDAVTTLTVDSSVGFPRTSEAGWLKLGTEYISYTAKTATTFTGCTRGANGTTAAAHLDAAVVDWIRNPLIGNDDGWLKLMYGGSSAYTDLSGIQAGVLKKDHFFDLFRALPQKYRRGGNRAALRWMMSSTQKSLWEEYLTDRATGAGDAVLSGKDFSPLGIPMLEVPSFPEDSIVLTYPKNLIVGIWRKIKVRKTDVAKESIMKDLIFYNSTLRMDFQIEETEAVSYGDGLVTA